MLTGKLDVLTGSLFEPGSIFQFLAGTGEFDTWTGNILDIGPIYPFVGSEVVLWIAGLVLWILWHIWQGRLESKTYVEDVAKFKGEVLAKAMRDDSP